ncbi:MAG: hypothetical protein ABI647_12550 [Gemmatimonadota bacterium]
MSRFASVGLLALTVLFGVELATRLEDWVRFGDSFLSRYSSQGDLAVRAPDGAHGRRNAQFEKWTMNNLGFRGPPADSAKAPGGIRVILSGASEAFGLYESPGGELARQLEDSLRERRSGAGCPIEVWNAAFAGMSLPTIAQDIRLRLRRFDPDLIVLYPTPAFYLDHSIPFATTPDSTVRGDETPSLALALLPRSWERLRAEGKELVPKFFATWLREWRVQHAEQTRGEGWRYYKLPPDRVDLFEVQVRDVVAAVREIGAQVILATHGNAFGFGTGRPVDPALLIAWERFHPRATSDVLIAFDSAARARVYRIAGDSLPVSDAALRLAQSPQVPFQDYAHFNDHGAAVAAGAIAETVAKALGGRLECH